MYNGGANSSLGVREGFLEEESPQLRPKVLGMLPVLVSFAGGRTLLVCPGVGLKRRRSSGSVDTKQAARGGACQGTHPGT